jgi:hypothetical protein
MVLVLNNMNITNQIQNKMTMKILITLHQKKLEEMTPAPVAQVKNINNVTEI